MNLDELTDIAEESRLIPDPFFLPRQIRQRVTSCSNAHCSCGVQHLWVHAGGGLFGYDMAGVALDPLPLESWMNVVDEAAALGAEWLVVTLEGAVANFPILWLLFAWAQETHGMNVALHMNEMRLCEADHANLLSLERSRTHLFVPTDQIALYNNFAEAGLTVKACDPDASSMDPCSMPGNMLFVTSTGKLYTCGMVHGNEDFALGHVDTGLFNEIIKDATKPHTVGKADMKRENGCMGCPPLVLGH